MQGRVITISSSVEAVTQYWKRIGKEAECSILR